MIFDGDIPSRYAIDSGGLPYLHSVVSHRAKMRLPAVAILPM